MSLEQRIIDLEIRGSYQEKVIGELDEVIREFSGRVQRLEALVMDLKESMTAHPSGPADDPPPHY